MGFQCFGGKKKVTFNPIVETFEYVSRDDEDDDDENIAKSILKMSSSFEDQSDFDDDHEGLVVNDVYEDDGIFEKSRKRNISGSAFVNPLLNPVTNISQWKAVKAKTTTLLRPTSPRRSPKYFGRRISVAQEMNSVRNRNTNVNPLLKPIENLAQWKALKLDDDHEGLVVNDVYEDDGIFEKSRKRKISGSAFVNPLLNPVTNISQWKAVKAKPTTPLRPTSPRRSPKYFGRRISVAQEMNSV